MSVVESSSENSAVAQPPPSGAGQAAPAQYLIHPIRSAVDRLVWGRLFADEQPLEIELGCGDGSFLAEYARRHPEHNFVGVERLLGRLRKLEKKGRRARLTNLRGLRIESAYFLRYLVPPHSARALHIYFPDPWPKRKHRRNRLINEAFPALAREVLAPEGLVFLRTDDQDYFEQMTAVFAAANYFVPVETPAELAGLPTDFEADFNAKGIPTRRAAYRARREPCCRLISITSPHSDHPRQPSC